MYSEKIIVAESTKKRQSSIKRNKIIMDIFVYAILIIGAITMVYPFIWMLSASFSSKIDVLSVVLLPKSFHPENYVQIMNALGGSFGPGYIRAILNTLLYSTLPVIVSTLVSTLAAFAFAKIDFIGKNKIFIILMVAIMIPFPSIMMEQFYLYSVFNWMGTPLPMIIPKLFGNIMVIFFIRQFLLGHPASIIESAKIDGASYPRIFIKMVLPLAIPAIVAQGLLGFMGSWNDYLGPLIFVRAKEWFPITVSLAKYNAGLHAQTQVVMAGSVVALIPILVLFGLFQRTIIESVMLSGSKE